MTESAPDQASEFNRKIIEEFRANGGRVGGSLAGATIVLLHHTGARSGIPRVTPLVGTPQEGDRIVIVASNGGSRTHPDWYYNLKANPAIDIEVGTQTIPVLAEELVGADRATVWPKLIADSPALREFQAKAGRQIPVFLLSRRT